MTLGLVVLVAELLSLVINAKLVYISARYI